MVGRCGPSFLSVEVCESVSVGDGRPELVGGSPRPFFFLDGDLLSVGAL